MLALLWLASWGQDAAAPPRFAAPHAERALVARWRAAGRALHVLAEDAPVDTDAGPQRVAAGTLGVAGEAPPGGTAFRLDEPAALLWTALPELPPGKRRLTPAMLYGDGPPLLERRPAPELLWLPGEAEYLLERGARTWLVNAQSGQAKPAEDLEKLPAAVAAALGGTLEQGRSALRGRRVYNPARTAFVLTTDEKLVYAALDGSAAALLDRNPAKRELFEFSPNGKFLAYTMEGNLWLADLAAKTTRALTSDGSATIRNGKADWVYFEELYDRRWKAFWWSPDSARLAFLRFDDSKVPVFNVVNDLPIHQKLEPTHYPKAGDPNPVVKLMTVDLKGATAEVPLPGDADRLLPRVGLTPAGALWFTMQDRLQTTLELHRWDGAATRRLLRETSPAWVEYDVAPKFLKDGRFVWASEADGYRHLFLHAADGAMLQRLTAGPWEVRKLVGIDEAAGTVAFTGTKDDPIAEKAYSVKLDGTGFVNLTPGPGDHAGAEMSPGGRWLIDAAGSRTVPTRTVLCSPAGAPVRTLDANPQPRWEALELAPYERLKIPMADGFVLEGVLVRPADFDPKKKYPVWLQTYGGPRMPTVRDAWRGGGESQALAAEGFVVFGCDPRSASGKGAVSGWTCYQRLGQGEVKDLDAAVAWLCREHPYCDAKRVGIEGFSYGGYLTAYCLTHSKTFAAGVAGAGPSDWRNYDSIYVERYMRRPQDNPAGYDAASVVKAAANLHGKLLLAHGLLDDNVHPQNSFQLLEALQRANKQFEFMAYPTKRHEGYGRHFGTLRLDFIKRTLGGPQPAAAAGAAP